MLHKIDTRGWETKTAWCVPTAISFLTGIPLIHSHSRAAFIQNVKLDEVKDVYSDDANLMLYEQGYKCVPVDLVSRYETSPTLLKFLRERTSFEKCSMLMIQICDSKNFNHMICAHYGFAADNHTMKPVEIEQFPHLRKKVVKAWVVSKKG